MKHCEQSTANANTSETSIPEANTTSTELCNITTDDMSLSNELQNFDFEDIKRN
jgi:hypothetical protein